MGLTSGFTTINNNLEDPQEDIKMEVRVVALVSDLPVSPTPLPLPPQNK